MIDRETFLFCIVLATLCVYVFCGLPALISIRDARRRLRAAWKKHRDRRAP